MLTKDWQIAALGLCGSILALGMAQAIFYVGLGKTGLFDVATEWGTKRVVMNYFSGATVLLSLILAIAVSLCAVGAMLWRRTHSLRLTVPTILVALAVYLTASGYGPDDLAWGIEDTVRWYHKLIS
jgi:hypothetical protein